MPRHSGPYWVVVWTLPITSIPRAKYSTGKLGQNGLIWLFLRSFWLYHRIGSFFHKWVDFFFSETDANEHFSSYGHILGQVKKKIWSNWPKLGQNGLIWPFLMSFWLYYRIRSFFHKWVDFFHWLWCQRVFFLPMDTFWANLRRKSVQIDLIWPDLRHFSGLWSVSKSKRI